MYYVQDAHSFWDWIYFATLIVVSCRGVDPARLDNDVSVAAWFRPASSFSHAEESDVANRDWNATYTKRTNDSQNLVSAYLTAR